MTWTDYGTLSQLILPHGRVQIERISVDSEEHRYRVEVHTDGNVRWFEATGYPWQVKRKAYTELYQHWQRTAQNLHALHESLERATAHAPEVG